MTEARRPCPFDLSNGVAYSDLSTFDRLHMTAGSLSYTAQHVEGVGGTTTEDPEEVRNLLSHAVMAVEQAADALDLAVFAARDHGWTWERIGYMLGTTRQAAQMRFGKGESR